jgi:hypothetical protein
MSEAKEKGVLVRRRAAPKDQKGLEEEIGLVREAIRKVAKEADEVDDVKVLLRLLDSLSSASQRLAGLLRAQRAMVGEKAGELPLKTKLDDVLEDLGREKGHIE